MNIDGASLTRRRFIARAAAFGYVVSGSQASARAPWTEGLETLGRTVDGQVVLASGPEYERLRHVNSRNPKFDSTPKAIVLCESESDVQRSIAFATENDLDLAVRSGGHDVMGASTCDGLIIDLSRLDHVRLATRRAEVTCGAGARAGRLSAVLGEQGQVAALGCNPAVGVSGLTLGGGLGWFIARHGATCDSVKGARIVLADGSLRAIGPDRHEELFWAIRGGGGNFGIVTDWTLATFQQGDVTAGTIVYSGSLLADVLRFYRENQTAASDALTVELVGLGHVEPVVAAAFVHSGQEKQARDELEPWLALGPPLATDVRRAPLHEITELSGRAARYFEWPGDPEPRGEPSPGSYWQGVSIDRLDDAAIDLIVAAVSDPPPGWSWGLGHMQRGACLAATDSPMQRVQHGVTVHFDAGWSHARRAAPLMSWVDESVKALDRLPGHYDYINYLSDDSPARVRRAYGAKAPRLLEIKRRVDPSNLFSRNRNLLP